MPRILIVGDSHTRYFGLTRHLSNIRPILKTVELNLKVVPGANLAGLGRRTSHTRLRETTREEIAGGDFSIFGLNLVQVDVELGYYYRAIVKGEEIPFQDFAAGIAHSMGNFLSEIKGMFSGDIFVKGVNPPVLCFNQEMAVRYVSKVITENIDDEKKRGEFMRKLSDNLPSDLERIGFHRSLNRLLSEACKDLSVYYYDICDSVLHPSTGLPRADYVPARLDHHLVDSLRTRLLHWDPVVRQFLRARRA